MKIIARAVALALALTGFIASTHSSASATGVAGLAKTSALPVPLCPPDGSTDCGIGNLGN